MTPNDGAAVREAGQLRAGDVIILTPPWKPGGLVPTSFGPLEQLKVLRVLPGGGNDGADVIHVYGWETQSWTFARFNERLAAGEFRVVRPRCQVRYVDKEFWVIDTHTDRRMKAFKSQEDAEKAAGAMNEWHNSKRERIVA